jgi:hypothetical protein
MAKDARLYFFKCAVSVDLYAVTTDADGRPLPTSGDIRWQAIDSLDALGEAAEGFDDATALADIARYGCHWFTSEGRVDIFWGEEGPPSAA